MKRFPLVAKVFVISQGMRLPINPPGHLVSEGLKQTGDAVGIDLSGQPSPERRAFRGFC